MFGTSRLCSNHDVPIANGVPDIAPGKSFPAIATNFDTREVCLRQRANVSHVSC